VSSASSRTSEDNRWTNIVLPSLYVVFIVASAIGETSAYYWFLSITECPAAADRLVRVDVAQAGGNTLKAANHVQCCFAVRGRNGGPPVTNPDLPTVTARARGDQRFPMPDGPSADQRGGSSPWSRRR
jgi:hypothetical protein